MDILSLLQYSLPYGVLLSVLLSVVIGVSLYWNAEMWLADYPPDIQEKYGPISDKAKKQKRVMGIFFLLAFFGPIVLALSCLNQLLAGQPIFWPAFFTTCVIFQVFNLVDLLILDWLFFVTWQPRFLILPGTEGLAGYKDYGFHFRGFLIGTVYCLVFSLIVAGTSLLWPSMPRESVDFLRQNQQTIVIEPEPVQFYLLDQAAQESRVIFLGESHGVTINEDLDFALFKYLYETAGVRTYIAETGYSMGHYINQYVQGGDEVLLRNSYAALEGTLGWNQSRFAFWQRVYAWNQTLPESERVRVVGLDVEHQYPVGVSHVFDLLPDGETPAGFSEPVAVLRTMVEERSWNSQDCLSAVDALLGELDAQPDVALAYLGDNLNELSLTLQSIQYGFEYYAIDDWRAASVTRDQRIYETYLALGLEQETVYGKWGRDHIYQAQYRSIDYIAQLLDTIDSPVAGQVLSISLIYADSTQLNIRNGQYRQSRLAAPRRIVGPLRRATDADVTLFRLTGAASPFDDALYLVDHPTGGGVTTDYMQFVMLVQGAEAATPLDE